MNRIARILAAVTFTAATVACLDDISGTRPVTFSMTADVTMPTLGQDVTFSYLATGTGVRRVVLDYGDGVVDTTNYALPVEVTDFLIHAFTGTGEYTVHGEVHANAGVASQELIITVN